MSRDKVLGRRTDLHGLAWGLDAVQEMGQCIVMDTQTSSYTRYILGGGFVVLAGLTVLLLMPTGTDGNDEPLVEPEPIAPPPQQVVFQLAPKLSN